MSVKLDRVGAFSIIRELGRGGMGVVYLGRDTRLERDVAIKALPEELESDPVRLERFEREARLLATLNHPNIGAIHGIEEVDGKRYLVLEYVEGQTLAERLTRGGMPVDETLGIACQIAEALESAHEKGIVHRDLKPGNIMLTPDGRAKVLDFGLARATDNAAASGFTPMPPNSPTMTMRGATPHSPTMPGVILGTAGYMSPEQARGRTVDKRSDIFSFGCVLYEMLSGATPFAGETLTDSLAATLKSDPDWAALSPQTPPTVRRLLRRCMERDPKKRLRDIGDARLEIESALGQPEEATAAPTRGRTAILVASIGVVALALGVGGGVFLRRGNPPAAPQPITRLEMSLAPAEALGPASSIQTRPYRPAFAITPDGRQVVFAGMTGETTQLFVRTLDAPEATAIPGTQGADTPFLSPDGTMIGFLADGEIRKVPVAGGPVSRVATLADAGLPSPSPLVAVERDFFGADWSDDGEIVFGRYRDGLWTVPASGGTPRRLTPSQPNGRLPRVLHGGKGILFSSWVSRGRPAVWWSPRNGGESRVLLEDACDARFVPPDTLLFARDGMLMRAPFDPQRAIVTGPAVALVPDVLHAIESQRPAANVGTAFFDVSQSGTLVYAQGGIYPVEPHRLVWVSRDGAASPIEAPVGYYARPNLSPDGKKLVVSHNPMNQTMREQQIHVLDLERGIAGRFTDEKGWAAMWSRDNARVFFPGNDPRQMFAVPADGSAPPSLVAKHELSLMASSESPDGSLLAAVANSETRGSDIVLIPLKGGEPVRPWLETPANEAWPVFSPDGKWLAYGSDVSGDFEVYVQPFQGPGPRVQVSVGGGTNPLWSHDGTELFYARNVRELPNLPGKSGRVLYAAPVIPGATLAFSKPKELFSGRYGTLGGLTGYDIAPDDQRFVMVETLDSPNTPVTRLHVVLHWRDTMPWLPAATAQPPQPTP